LVEIFGGRRGFLVFHVWCGSSRVLVMGRVVGGRNSPHISMWWKSKPKLIPLPLTPSGLKSATKVFHLERMLWVGLVSVPTSTHPSHPQSYLRFNLNKE
jgi:hypothetical protein